MLQKRIQLTDDAGGAYLDVYVAEPMKAFLRKGLLICPGGGYEHVSPREGEPIVQAFMPYGYNAFVLHYTVGRESGKPFPAQLIEAMLAIKHIKDHAEEYGIAPEELFVVGFSAGGHLAASVATLWKSELVGRAVDMPYGYGKVRGVMLVYPMISSKYCKRDAYLGAFGNLWCSDEPSEEQLRMASMENHVDADTVPAFMLQSFNDPTVDVRNALAIADAYAVAGVPFELHVYPDAPHGFSVANEITAGGRPHYVNPTVAQWVRQAAEWVENLLRTETEDKGV